MSLTKHAEGSIRELLALALPLMLTSLSGLLMIFADRLLLSHYSSEAHNIAVGASTVGWSFLFGWMVLTSISEVFVAQYNGAGMRSRLGEPVWQTIWISVLLCLFFLPLSIWGGSWFFGSGAALAAEREYFGIMVIFGPFYAFYAALCGFFIGQGKTRLITVVVVVANVVNILLDWALIFGVAGVMEPMGVKGAAIATSLATVFQGCILFVIFLSPTNRKEYGTSQWKLKWTVFKDCVRVGLPTALFVIVEILAYGIYYGFMREKGINYITVTGICQTMLLLFFFFSDGMNKATATVVGNLIGAGRSHLILKVIKSGLLLNVIFLVLLLLSFWLGMPLIIDQFLPFADSTFLSEIDSALKISLILMAFYIFFEGIRMQFGGVLTAAGDTLFLMIIGALSVWGMMLLPVYIFIVQFDAPVEFASMICMIYSAAACCIYYWRIANGKWRSLSISSDIELHKSTSAG